MNYKHTQRIKSVELLKFYIKLEEVGYLYFDLDVTLTLMCDLDLIDDL